MTKEEILKEIDLAESCNPCCTCGSWDCYDCYATRQIDDMIADLKQQLKELEEK